MQHRPSSGYKFDRQRIGAASLRFEDDEAEPRPLVVIANEIIVGYVAPDVHNEVLQLIELDLPLEMVLDHTNATLSVAIRAEPAEA